MANAPHLSGGAACVARRPQRQGMALSKAKAIWSCSGRGRNLVAAVALSLVGTPALAANMPPQNPYLADSSYSMAHGGPAQQDSVAQAGPAGPSMSLTLEQINYRHLGPGHFGTAISGVYPDGKRVYWGNGIDRIAKIDHETFQVLQEYPFPDEEIYREEEADAAIAAFDQNNDGFLAVARAFLQMLKYRDLANIYTVLDRDHNYYIGSRDGAITAYGDADPNNSRSAIVKLREMRLPPEVTGFVMGLNMTYDGWLLAVTEHGYVVLVKRDFSDTRVLRLRHSEGAEEKTTGATGRGWIRNGPAVDVDGGIYIASQEHMHKVVWDGEELSSDPGDDAWTIRYPNSWGHGTGATPSLMGFGGEDRFVVITDGEPRMNVVLYWRDGIPEDWPGLPGHDRRVAGVQPVTMGDASLLKIQSEQSVVVSGYGALVVNNEARNIPWYLPERARGLLIGLLGSNPRHQPYGVQKFAWQPKARSFEPVWVNREISSPSAVPMVSVASNLVYLVGARDGKFTLEALDWSTGESRFHYVIGGQRYNVMYAGTLLDESGRVHYGTPWGRVRLEPLGGSPHPQEGGP